MSHEIETGKAMSSFLSFIKVNGMAKQSPRSVMSSELSWVLKDLNTSRINRRNDINSVVRNSANYF